MPQRPTITELKQPFIGRWRIVGADCFDRDYIDLCGEAYLTVPPEGRGEISFGALVAGLDFSFAPGALFFDWHGSDEMDESTGQGVMKLVGVQEAEIELECSSGDVAVLMVVRIANG